MPHMTSVPNPEFAVNSTPLKLCVKGKHTWVQTFSISAEEGRETAKIQYTRRGWFTHPTRFLLLLWYPISLLPGKEGHSRAGSQQWPLGHHSLHAGNQTAASGPKFCLSYPQQGTNLGCPPLHRCYFTQFLGASLNFETSSSLSNMVEKQQAGLKLSWWGNEVNSQTVWSHSFICLENLAENAK